MVSSYESNYVIARYPCCNSTHDVGNGVPGAVFWPTAISSYESNYVIARYPCCNSTHDVGNGVPGGVGLEGREVSAGYDVVMIPRRYSSSSSCSMLSSFNRSLQ